MLEPYANEVIWIVALGFIIAFFLAFGVGANDVANSFGTSVGSGVLTLKQACILATIFEILGALLMGYKVSDTVRKNIFDIEMYYNDEKVLMMGNMAALLGSALWNLLATFLRLPVSGTHGIIGAVLGFTMVARGFKGIQWKTLGFIVSSWFLSPLLSGLMSTLLFLFIRKFILNQKNDIEWGLKFLPVFYGFAVFVNVFSVVHDGSSVLYFDRLSWWTALIIAFVVGVATALFVRLFVVPRQTISLTETKKTVPEEQKTVAIELQKLTDKPTETVIAGEEDTFIEKTLEDTSLNKINEDTEENDDKPEIAGIFKGLQILTAIFGSFAHGGNDVSNAIAPLISLWIIYAEGSVEQESETPLWLLLYGGAGISAGLWIMGRKVIQTMGKDLTKITPSSGFTIEIGAATTVLLASKIGLPISTTHCKVGSVVCVGSVRNKESKRVDLRLFRNIVLAWLVTLPFTALLSAIATAVFYAIIL